MQEQVPSNITPEQGWSMMKNILDREMPARKNARRIPLFWWSTAIVMVIGLSGFVLMINQQTSTSPVPPVQPPSPAIPEKPVEQNAKTQEENIYADAQNPVEQSLQKTTSGKVSTSHGSTAAIATSGDNNKQSNSDKTRNQDQMLNASTITFSSENSWIAHTLPAEQTAQYTAADGIIGSKGISTATAIPVLPFNEFETAEPKVDQVEAKLTTPKKKRKTSFSPHVELASLTGSGGTGLSLGLGLDAKIAPRVTVGGSVGYRSFDPSSVILGFGSRKAYDNASLENNSIIHEDGFNYDVPGFYVAAERLTSARYAEVDPVVENLHQWQSQLGLSYQLSRKFSMEAGVGVSFNTKAYSEFPIVQHALDGSNANISNSLNDYDVVRQSNTSFYAGFTYHLGKHVSLKAQWWQTNQPYLTLENTNLATGAPTSIDRDDYIRGLNIGVKYSIL